VVSFMLWPLYPKSPWYPLHRRLGGPQSRCGEILKINNTEIMKVLVYNDILMNILRFTNVSIILPPWRRIAITL